ncbi:MAG TPA: M23 family metallopeptidase [Actinomycetota bacterium]
MRARWVAAAALLALGVWIPALVGVAGGARSTPPRQPSIEGGSAPPATPVFAEALGIRLHLPASSPRLVAFHEASMEGALPMLPHGRCRPCRHPRFRPGPAGDLRYAVMDPRGRGSPPTSAVDVVVSGEARVLSPVSGRVIEARRYRLYGRHPDVRVAIAPDGAPGIEVVLLHLRSGRLAPGDRVVAGVTPLGRARSFSFRSQVDRYTAGRLPHVHVEVVDARARNQAQSRRGPGG